MGSGVCFLPPSHFISWLKNFALKAVADCREGPACLTKIPVTKARWLNTENSPLKSLAMSHLPDPPTWPLFQATENSEFSMMITRIKEGKCHLSK